MGSSCSLVKVLFGALAAAGFICLLLIGSLESEGNSTRTVLTTKSAGNFKHEEDLGRTKLINYPESDLNNMSKRRVPNGPDPIHNRRAGKYRRPPGQS